MNRHLLRFAYKNVLATLTLYLMLSSSALAIVYSDGENGTTGWSIFDATPSGASITTVNDSEQQSTVIQTQGAGRSNSYLLGNVTSQGGWNNSLDQQLSWSMSTYEPYALTLYVNTSNGSRRLLYSHATISPTKNPNNNVIRIGLERYTIDGEWRDFSRNLQSDISTAEPGNTLLSVYGLVAAGNLRLDDIALTGGSNPEPDQPPTAAFSVSASSGAAPLVVSIDASASSDDNGIATYQYLYGDGSSRTRPVPTVSHTYENPGTYTLTLIVTDTAGQTNTVSRQINVIAEQSDASPTAALSVSVLHPPMTMAS